MRYTLSLVALLCGIGAISPAYAACPTNDTCSFLYSGGTYTELTPQGSSSVASGINDKGQIVGFSGNGINTNNGFLYSGGAYHTLSYPGSSQTYLYGINHAGQIVGAAGSFGFGTATTGSPRLIPRAALSA
jgi:probable HAF family extracellular repeat protein